MKKYVYLAGPIEGCSLQEIDSWRNFVCDHFYDDIIGVNPTRITSKSPDCIITQNYFDTKTCDLILAYLPKEINDRRASYGTIFEIAWAYSLQKPIIIVSDDDYVHNHPVLQECGVHFDKLEDSIYYINQLFSEYVQSNKKYF